MTANIFTYGSLMFADVWQRVVCGKYRFAPAQLSGHVRLAVADETYPGMIASAGNQVHGVVYFDVAPDDLERLDEFEGSEYRRVTLDARVGDAVVPVDTYLFTAVPRLLEQEWRPEEFQQQRFFDTYCRDKLEQVRSAP